MRGDKRWRGTSRISKDHTFLWPMPSSGLRLERCTRTARWKMQPNDVVGQGDTEALNAGRGAFYNQRFRYYQSGTMALRRYSFKVEQFFLSPTSEIVRNGASTIYNSGCSEDGN